MSWPTTYLYRNIGTGDITITVPQNAAPSQPGVLLIDSEQIHYQSADQSNFFGCTRGYNSTSAATHATGAAVSFVSFDDPTGEGDLVGTTPVSVSGGTQSLVGSSATVSMAKATSTTDGYLYHSDWVTFNGKQAALGFTAVPNTLTVNGAALSGNIVVTASVPILSTDPMSPTEGQVWYNSTSHVLKYRDNSGTQVVAVVS